MISPTIIKNFLSETELKWTQDYYNNFDKSKMYYNRDWHRYEIDNGEVSSKILNSKVDQAKEIFKSDTLLPTFSFFAKYTGNAFFPKHKDVNACTYTLDFCLHQSEPWDLWVDDKNYTLQENEALAFYGEAQDHERKMMPNPKNEVSLIFLHYAEPDHWWFKK